MVPADIDCMILANKRLSAEEIESLGQQLAHSHNLAGTRTIGPACIHCLQLFDGKPAQLGVLVPQDERSRVICDGYVVVYSLCGSCVKPNPMQIRENVYGTMLYRRQQLAAGHDMVVAARARA